MIRNSEHIAVEHDRTIAKELTRLGREKAERITPAAFASYKGSKLLDDIEERIFSFYSREWLLRVARVPTENRYVYCIRANTPLKESIGEDN